MWYNKKHISFKFSESNQTLEILATLETELIEELQAKKQKLLEALPAAGSAVEDNWRDLNTTFTDQDLKGLIFISQRKLTEVARELKELKTVQHEKVEEALNVSKK